ncbi:beta-1 adrenergic receptor-like [Saccoglossus kowalevskii]|uniref:Beta-1 adrenergic receptor-like n=1 Tax=Saccoglossus kowalevskii TaxID=10224 RepID=A0ABM0MT24_SACKO|nr:PREDICTED: beta-1 adrenergic receptor-like [Saccoglossus kowalevskii]
MRLVITGVWVTGILVTWPTSISSGATTTTVSDEQCSVETINNLIVFAAIIAFFIPLIILLYTNISISCVVRNQYKKIQAQVNSVWDNSTSRQYVRSRQRHAIKTTTNLIVVFILMWMPYFCMSIVYVCYPDNEIVQNLLYYFGWLGYANSAINPWLYAHNRDFRSAYKQLLTCKSEDWARSGPK